MSAHLHTLLFGIYPYICITVFLLGSVIRFNRDQYSWRSGSSQLLRRRQFMLGSNLFHVGILVIFFGHLIGLLTPITVFDALGVSHGVKQLLSIVVGGVAGVFCLIGLTLLAHRRLFDARIRKTSTVSDILVLLILWVQLVLGLLTIGVSVGHLDGAEMVRFMAWAQMLMRFDLNAGALLIPAHLLFKLHIVLGLTVFLIFPFTRLVHIWSAPIWYLGRRGYQIVRSARDVRSS